MTLLKPFYLVVLFSALCSCIYRSGSNVSGSAHSFRETILWPNPTNIPVCWEPYAEEYLYDIVQNKPGISKAEVFSLQPKLQSLATAEYAKAGIHLTGWGACQADNHGIRIRWNQGYSRVQKIGYQINGIESGLLLSAPSSDYSIEVFYWGFLHELGHALGLRHEHEREDGKFYESEAIYHISSGPHAFALGSYDIESIMNYSSEDALIELSNANKPVSMPRLSKGDIETIRNSYYHPTVIAESL